MSADNDDAWSRGLDEERKLAPWRRVIWRIEEVTKPKEAKEALRELAKLLRQGDEVPRFAYLVLAELIDPQHEILDIKLVPELTSAFGRLKHKEIEESDLVGKIEAEMKATGCTQEEAIEKIAPSRSTGHRALKAARERQKQIDELLAKFRNLKRNPDKLSSVSVPKNSSKF
jgi:hypothetical protein